MKISRPKIPRFFALAIVLLNFIPHVHCLKQNDSNTIIFRKHGWHRKLGARAQVLDAPNKVHVSVVHSNYSKYLAAQDNFLSANIAFDLYPVDYVFDESQKKIFSRGLHSFLKAMVTSQTVYDLNILSVSVTNMKSSDISDSAHITKQMNKDQTLNVQTVIAAQQNLESTNLSQYEFNEYIMNLCVFYKEDMMLELIDMENEVMNGDDDKYTVDSKMFQHIQEVKISLSKDIQLIQHKAELSPFGVTILISFVSLLLVFMALLLFKYYRKRSQLHNGLKDYRKEKSLEDYLKKHQCDDITFAPYGQVELPQSPTSRSSSRGEIGGEGNTWRSKTHKYSKNFQKGNSYDEQESNQIDNIPSTFEKLHESIGRNGDDHNDVIYYDDNRTVSSVGSNLTQSLSTDGTLFMGECYAPPGKVGIAIDTINNQPVIHRVRDDSPLVGILRRLDIIIAVDEVDTSSMTAAEVTQLMAQKMGSRRKITYLRGETATRNLVQAATY